MSVETEQVYYQKNKRNYLSFLSNETNIKIKQAEFYKSTGSFKILEDNIDTYFSNKGNLNISGLTTEKIIMRSITQNPKTYKLKVHDSITISLPCGSHIRFCPYKNDSIEISRLLVSFNRRKKGVGSQLMSILFQFIEDTLGFIPNMYLECTGSVGFDILNSTSTQIQTAFFRKHGFKVNNGKYNPRYVILTRPKQVKNNSNK